MRTFIAIELPKRIQQTIQQEQQQLEAWLAQTGQQRVIHWTQPAKVHLTLRFLGETTEPQRQTLQQKLTAITAQQKPFALELNAIGGFPNLNRPNIIWLGLHHSTALDHLQAQVEKTAQAAGFAAEDQAFRPHLTIGRTSRSLATFQRKAIGQRLAQWLALPEHSVQPATTFIADQLVHMQSQIQPTGAIYNALDQFKFMGTDSGEDCVRG
jgi:RNA 2',3'-cyclic 3'-phosphodiesterase